MKLDFSNFLQLIESTYSFTGGANYIQAIALTYKQQL